MFRALALATLLIGLTVPPRQTTPALLDPVGKWTFTAVMTDGQAMSGTVDVTGTLGAYKGTAYPADGSTVPVSDVMTSAKSMILVLQLSNSFAIVKITQDAAGKFSGQWGELTQVMPVTMVRAGK